MSDKNSTRRDPDTRVHGPKGAGQHEGERPVPGQGGSANDDIPGGGRPVSQP
jgi:hypothetical protein